jgi:trehalose/maltose transport system permease protein
VRPSAGASQALGRACAPEGQYQTFYNLIDAAVMIISIPIALLVLFAQRRIVSCLTAGSFR